MVLGCHRQTTMLDSLWRTYDRIRCAPDGCNTTIIIIRMCGHGQTCAGGRSEGRGGACMPTGTEPFNESMLLFRLTPAQNQCSTPTRRRLINTRHTPAVRPLYVFNARLLSQVAYMQNTAVVLTHNATRSVSAARFPVPDTLATRSLVVSRCLHTWLRYSHPTPPSR